MKKHLLYLMSAPLLLLAGCKGEPPPEYDYFNTDIRITVEDSDGANLFDARHADNMRDNDVRIEYGGKIYLMKDITGSRADKNLPKWDEDGRDPFRLNGYLDKARLLFGEFSVDTKQYRDEPFTISWGDGTTSQVTFDLYTTSNGKGQEPTVHQAIRVTGGAGAGSKSDSSLIFTIVK